MRKFLGIVIVLALSGNVLAAEKEWIPLFDGKTLDGWTTDKGKPVTKGWKVTEAGELYREERGGQILSTREFTNFELRLEFKIAPGGNSGVKYRLKTVNNRVWGLEYQIFDDAKIKKNLKTSKTSCGAMYAMYAPDENKKMNPAGEYNELRIVVSGSKIEHWLNGMKIVDVDTTTTDWKDRLGKSKYRGVKGFAPEKPTKILLQDHGSKVWFRNVRIRELD